MFVVIRQSNEIGTAGVFHLLAETDKPSALTVGQARQAAIAADNLEGTVRQTDGAWIETIHLPAILEADATTREPIATAPTTAPGATTTVRSTSHNT